MADIVQEQMGDILSAYGIPELADDIVPIPVQPPEADDHGGGGSPELPDHEPKETENMEKSKQDPQDGGTTEATMSGLEPADSSDRVDSDEKMTDDTDSTLKQDNKSAGEETVVVTENSHKNLEQEASKTCNSQPSAEDIATPPKLSGEPGAQAVPQLGLTQSVAVLNSNKKESSLIRELLTSTSKPVMTPLPQDTLANPSGSESVRQLVARVISGDPKPQGITRSELPESPEKASTLSSVDEFNSYFDRCKEIQELQQMKNNLLGKNSGIPSYQCPRLTDEQALALNMKKETFKCAGCDDTFLFKASLDVHMERRTVFITFHCSWCEGRQDLVFYNRCNFLAHLHGHSVSEKEIEEVKFKADVAPVTPLDSVKIFTKLTAPVVSNTVSMTTSEKVPQNTTPPSALKTIPNRFANLASSIPAPRAPQRPSAGVGSTSSTEQSKEEESVSQTITMYPKKERAPNFNTFLCCGCHGRFTRAGLKNHLQLITETGPFQQCRVCKLTLANKCQLAIHAIIHAGGRQHMFPCPQCGCIFTNMKALLIHGNEGCLHWMRRPLFKCTFCFKYATSFQGLIRHFESNHIETFFKCPLCQLAFRNSESAKEHSLQVHRMKAITYGLLHKCPLCKSVYSEKKMLENHFDMHYQNGNIKIEKFVLTCFKCFKPFDYHSGIRNHLASVHGKSNINLYSCDLCLATMHDIDMLLQHRFSCSFKKVDAKPNNQTNQQSLKIPVSQTQKQFMCGECGEKFPSLDVTALRKHMLEKHLEQVSNAATKGGAKNPVTQNAAQNATNAVASETQPATDTQKNVPVVEKKAAVKVERFTELRCAKCDHKSSDRVLFERHIVQHKADERLAQCHECGLCFTVPESLKRHLVLKHKIKLMAAYNELCEEIIRKGEEEMKKKKKLEEKEKEKEVKTTEIKEEKMEIDTTSARKEMKEEEKKEEKKQEEEEEQEEQIPQFKCHVCSAEFENDKALTVHKRSHGLAYLQHQLSRSPEKAARALAAKSATTDVKAKPEAVAKPAAVRSIIPSDTESSNESSDDSVSQ